MKLKGKELFHRFRSQNRLYRFLIETFLPVFFMTFVICIFVLLMQFIWKYVNELVGKGLSLKVMAEFFFYAAASLVPMALPLSVLLSSLMTFGGLGERLELLSMKSAGISLGRMMKPLLILTIFISICSFVYQNEMGPRVQVKMWGLLFSMKQKSPELDIPEKSFYDQISGYNMYVERKNKETGMLYDVMIYDFSRGFDNGSVFVADSAYLKMTSDKKYLFMTMYNGESFENLQKQRTSSENVPYRRETFSQKVVLIEFDATFSRMDDSFLQSQYVGMSMNQLGEAAAVSRKDLDSVSVINERVLAYSVPMVKRPEIATMQAQEAERNKLLSHQADSLARYAPMFDRQQIVQTAIQNIKSSMQEVEYRSYQYAELKRSTARYELEWNRKITLSLSCLIFFFIGAPLGAIVRKGGLGMPVVLSVFIFIFYYVIDNTGMKFSRDSLLTPFMGMWLSSFILAPLGAFLTYKAARDSVLMNADAYMAVFNRLLLRKRKREVVARTIKMNEVTNSELLADLGALSARSRELLQLIAQRNGYFAYWKGEALDACVSEYIADEERLVNKVLEATCEQAVYKLNDYPLITMTSLEWTPSKAVVRRVFMYCLPVGLVWYALYLIKKKTLTGDINTILRINKEIENLL